jgi:sec-independent protein translocase protein TatB
MFDVGFSELLVIGVVALIVIGPERLPKVARTAGHLFGRLQRYVADVKADINRELELEELRKLKTQVQDAARSIEQSVHQASREFESSVRSVEQDFADAAKGVSQTPSSSSIVAAPASSGEAPTTASPGSTAVGLPPLAEPPSDAELATAAPSPSPAIAAATAPSAKPAAPAAPAASEPTRQASLPGFDQP